MLPDDPPALDDAVLCDAPGCPRRPLTGRLCRHHGDQLGQWLAEIGADFAALERLDALTPAGPSGGDAASSRRATKVKSRGAPVNLDVLTLTDRRIAWLTDDDLDDLVDAVGRDTTPRALEVLAWWAAHVRAGRGLVDPVRVLPAPTWSGLAGPACAACRHPSCIGRRLRPVEVLAPALLTVEGERRVLVRHFVWCLAQPWAGAMWRSIRQLWLAVKAARGEEGARPVATCRAPLDPGLPIAGGVCGGPVWSEPGVGWCGRCGRLWTGRELLELTRKGAAA